MTLNGVHEGFLDAVKDYDSEHKEDDHKAEAVRQPAPAYELSHSKESVFECLYYWCYRVYTHYGIKIHACYYFALYLT